MATTTTKIPLVDRKMADVAAQLALVLPFLSVVAETLSRFLDTSVTITSSVMFYPLVIVILPVFIIRRVSVDVSTLLVFNFCVWIMIVLLLMSPLDFAAWFRFISLLWQLILMVFVELVLCRRHFSVDTVFRNFGISCGLAVALSNLLYPDLGFSLSYVAFVRYKGLYGPNQHGMISALAAMSFISYFGDKQFSAVKRVLFRILILWLIANVWASGSRLSMLTLVVFVILFSKDRRYVYGVLVAILVIGFAAYKIFLDAETARRLLRLDEYHLWGRINPPLWGWQMARANYFQAYGFGTLREDLINQRLDNSFVILLLEVGLIGFGLMIGIIFLTLYRCHILERHLQNREASDVRAIRAILVALCLHGLGENSLFTSSNIATVLFLTLIGATHAIYKSTRAIRHHRLSGRWGRDAASTSR